MKVSGRSVRALVVLVVVAAAAAALARSGQSGPSPAAQPGTSRAEPVAVVDGETLTTADVDTRAASQLAELRAQEKKVREDVLEDLIDERLVQKAAAAKGVSVDEYLKVEIEQNIVVTEEEKKSTLERYRAELGGISETDAMARIEQALRQQKAEEMRQALVGRLRSTASVRMLVEPTRLAVDIPANAPAKGPADAPVTIVEFSDFQCPFCSRVNPTIDQVVHHYGNSVRIVFRDFPLPMHQEAPKAHEAGRCAAEQGQFWPMHDRMFADQAALAVDGLKKSAVALGMDAARFNTCLDSGKHGAAVQQEIAAGQSYGVTGTPAFFVNGRLISGALPFAQFSRLINDELQRKGIVLPATAAGAQ